MPKVEEQAKAKAEEQAKEAQHLVNAYHRVFSGPDWDIVRKDLELRFTMKKPGAAFGQTGAYDPYRGVFVEGTRAVMWHIEGMLEVPVKGDANVEEPAVTIRK